MTGMLVLVIIIGLVLWLIGKAKRSAIARPPDLSALPARFVIFDLETTGLDPAKHEVIEIGAIRVNRDSENHETFQVLVKPRKRVTKRITDLTGLSNEMLHTDGVDLGEALSEFRTFVGDLPLVAFNAPFDEAFLKAACTSTESIQFTNEICCALKLARRAWPDRRSYKLSALAKDGNLLMDGEHRALDDCRRTMIVYAAAASATGSYR